ncbi:MAG: TIGR03618 family F420-dependent PPOX class oxidoreductase [Anaerolineales bacterium]|nr:TIGR03618 family F420-dependent PPOX class oxidoreductase [Anaerolineales bacterium]
MPPTQEKINAFLSTPKLLGRLATVSPDGQPHVVPVWYLWETGRIWIHSYPSTQKIAHLDRNPRCAFVVDVQEAVEGLTAVLFEGRAELVTTPRPEVRERAERIYQRYLGPQELAQDDPQSWLDSPEGLLIKLIPDKVKSW